MPAETPTAGLELELDLDLDIGPGPQVEAVVDESPLATELREEPVPGVDIEVAVPEEPVAAAADAGLELELELEFDLGEIEAETAAASEATEPVAAAEPVVPTEMEPEAGVSFAEVIIPAAAESALPAEESIASSAEGDLELDLGLLPVIEFEVQDAEEAEPPRAA